MDAFVFVLFLLWKRCCSNTRKRITRTPETDPIVIAVLLFDKVVIVVVAFVVVVAVVVEVVVAVVGVVAVVVLVVDAFLQKSVMEAILSNWQIQ